MQDIDFEMASRIVGLLYGNILHRNADSVGFEFHVSAIHEKRLNVPEAIVKFYQSDEFAEKFIFNQTINELTHNLLNSLFPPATVTTTDFAKMRRILVTEGVGRVVSLLMEDARYVDRHGQIGVPRYVERRAGVEQRIDS